MKTKLFLLLLLVFFTISFSFAQNKNTLPNWAGKIWQTSNCASGGDDYYFFENNNVIVNLVGSENIIAVYVGKWKALDKKNVQITLQKAYLAVPNGKITTVSSINHYDNYVAKVEKINKVEKIALSTTKDGCEELKTHDKKFDVHLFLVCDFKGIFSDSSTRELTQAELNNLSRAELGLARNEIFARYGYEFKTSPTKEFFAMQKGYVNRNISDVAAFLTEIELKNINLIKATEANR
jgi:hypothetical protein